MTIVKKLLLASTLTIATLPQTTQAQDTCEQITQDVSFCPKERGMYIFPFEKFDSNAKQVLNEMWGENNHLAEIFYSGAHSKFNENYMSSSLINLPWLNDADIEEISDFLRSGFGLNDEKYRVLSKEVNVLKESNPLIIRLSFFTQLRTESTTVRLSPLHNVIYLSAESNRSGRMFLISYFLNVDTEKILSKWEEDQTLDDFRISLKGTDQIHLDAWSTLTRAQPNAKE